MKNRCSDNNRHGSISSAKTDRTPSMIDNCSIGIVDIDADVKARFYST